MRMDRRTGPWVAWGITTFESEPNNPLGIPAGYGALGGSGGGASNVGGYTGNLPADIPAPPWQQTAVERILSRAARRLDARRSEYRRFDRQEPYGLASGTLSDIGGTSVAAPQMAAMWADVLSACKAHPGAGMWRRTSRLHAVSATPPHTSMRSTAGTKIAVCRATGARIQSGVLRHRLRRQPDGQSRPMRRRARCRAQAPARVTTWCRASASRSRDTLSRRLPARRFPREVAPLAPPAIIMGL